MKRDLPFADPLLLQALAAESALGRAQDARQRGDLALALAHAMEAHDQAPLDALQGVAGWLACFCHFRLGQHRPLLALGEGLLPLLQAPDRRLELLRWLTVAAAETGHFATARRCATEALELAEQADDANAATAVRQALALCFERMGDPWRALQLLRECLPQAEGQPVLAPLLGVLQQLARNSLDGFHLMPHRAADDPTDPTADALERARAWAHRAQALTERIGDQHFRAGFDGLVGEALLHQGAVDEAWPLLERALCQAQAGDQTALAWRMACTLSEAQLLRGDAPGAQARLLGLLADGGDALPHTLLQRTHLALAEASHAMGQTERADGHRAQVQRLQAARVTWQAGLDPAAA